ncbi:DUF805 domain-containing protein [Halomonas mongoliensis]|uniref:DUF805 domain-containing protein n=1 Tax=Halomonas mongoliensis TaxID=321265 RepID=UPI00403ACE03
MEQWIIIMKTIKDNYITAIKRRNDLKGKSGRPEFWYFYLVVLAVSLPLSLLEIAFTALGSPISTLFKTLTLLWTLAHLWPGLAVAIRRLSDTGRGPTLAYIAYGSGAMMLLSGLFLSGIPPHAIPTGTLIFSGLIAITAIISYLLLLVFACFPAEEQMKKSKQAREVKELMEEIDKLEALRQSGTINDKEYQQMRQRLMGEA